MENNGTKIAQTNKEGKSKDTGNSSASTAAPKKNSTQAQDPPKDMVPPPPETPTGPSEEKKETVGDPKVKSAMEKLKERSKNATAAAMITAAERLSMFDSTKASSIETTGTSGIKSISPANGGFMVSGRNIGSEEREPKWTDEQKAFIKNMCATELVIADVRDTRRSVMDPEQKFVGKDTDGSIVPQEEAYVSSLDPSTYCIGKGPGKFDITGSPRCYTDLVVVDVQGRWLLNQWTSEWIVIEGVSPQVLMQTGRAGNQSNRRIGHHFARIGLPKLAFGPLFGTLQGKYSEVTSTLVETEGYYWTNASWGVSQFSGSYSYMTENGVKRTSHLSDVMRMLNGKSALCLATVAISLTVPAKSEGGKFVAEQGPHGLSIKLHNAFGVEEVDYHGPPQQGSTGMMVPSRIAMGAKVMSGSKVSTSAASGNMGIFANTTRTMFGGMNANGPPSIKSDDNASYM